LASSYHQLGRIAQERGDYATAERYYRDSLAIKEEVGDRAGLASSYHQLGRIAQERGDYATAERYYRDSLAIEEELGNRAGLASTLSQIGILRTEQDRPAEGVTSQVQALALRLDIGDRVQTDLYWLRQQRALLGDEAFRAILRDMLSDDDSVGVIMDATQHRGDATPESPSPDSGGQ
ncbi:tetratricopeptide repeat protein, partial [Streptacidiphilus sp. EB103A]|uniref:tetratricopeptide repeat protein n=1 Tax=Streptacidiphilus sp. EB103A TaxID=3156275 RepID=UPI003514BCDD